MPLLLLGLLLLIVLAVVVRMLTNPNPAGLADALRDLLVGLGLAVGGLLIVVILMRSPMLLLDVTVILLVPLALVLFFLWRRRRVIQALGARSGSAGAQSSSGPGVSTVRTAWLEMTLDHASGAMGGTVLHGVHTGRRLDDLSEAMLAQLLAECAADEDSVRVLEAYLDRRFGRDWRQRAAASGAAGTQGTYGGQGGAPPRGPRTDMSLDEAYAVLGLKPGATPDEIRAAHRKLMLLNHPDRGGSDWLAAKINRARQVLLGD